MQRRQFTQHLLKLAIMATLGCGTTVAFEQALPRKPITIEVSFAAGGPSFDSKEFLS